MANKIFLFGTKANLPEIRDPAILYFTTDTLELYKGMESYSQGYRQVISLPAIPAIGVIYELESGTKHIWNGTEWKTVGWKNIDSASGTVLLTISNTDSETPSAKLVYDSIVAAVQEATSGGNVVNTVSSTAAGTITVTSGTTNTDVELNSVLTSVEYDAVTRTISLTNSTLGTTNIELGKDIFIDPTADNKYNPITKNIELWLNDGNGGTPTLIEIPAVELVDIYTGGETNSVKVNVASNNEITADVKISATEGNKLSIATDGLYLDDSSFATGTDIQDVTNIVTMNKSAAELAISNLTDEVNVMNDTNVNTVGSIAKAVNDAKVEIKVITDNIATDITEINDPTTGILALAKAYTDERLEWGTF